jgi:hypothetical protein
MDQIQPKRGLAQMEPKGHWGSGMNTGKLSEMATLSSLPTPNASEPGGELRIKADRQTRNPEFSGNYHMQLGRVAELSPLPTPHAVKFAAVPTPQSDEKNSRSGIQDAQGYSERRLNRPNACSQLADTVQALSPASLVSVPTPNCPTGGPNTQSTPTHTGGRDLDGVAMLAAVPTPMAGSPATETYNEAGNNDYSRKIVSLASPSARDWKSNQASEDFYQRRRDQTRGKPLNEQTQQLAVSGETATGGGDATGSGGQLNPAYSRWLMGLPAVWCDCAVTGMQSCRKLRKPSSKAT